ncbi:Uncharacterised protein [Escherichia coli]|nr:Uncharacterised protein [Escherichia coli]
MAKFKSLIVSAKFEVASRKTTCKHDKKHVITKGEFRLSVKNSTQGESLDWPPESPDSWYHLS